MRIAVCPGSFDPVTCGHVSMIERGAKLFDEVYVCVMVNAEKSGLFTAEERVILLKKALQCLPNVKVEQYQGLLTDYTREKDACCLLKGVRNGTDLDYEMPMAELNRDTGNVETILMPAEQKYLLYSSSVARELIRYEKPLNNYVPDSIIQEVEILWKKKKEG